MLVLTLDTSTPAVTVAVSQLTAGPGVETLDERTEVATNRHGELLAPMIESVLREAGAVPSDLAAVGVGLGPGPFTGLRVGIMTAAALGDALGIPVYGECSLDVIADSVHGNEFSYAVLSDARRKQVYWAVYDGSGRRADGPEVATPADVAGRLSGRVTHLAGIGALLYRELFSGFTVIEEDPYPHSGALAPRVAEKLLRSAPADDLTPLYLRRPDATPPHRPKQVTPA